MSDKLIHLSNTTTITDYFLLNDVEYKRHSVDGDVIWFICDDNGNRFEIDSESEEYYRLQNLYDRN